MSNQTDNRPSWAEYPLFLVFCTLFEVKRHALFLGQFVFLDSFRRLVVLRRRPAGLHKAIGCIARSLSRTPSGIDVVFSSGWPSALGLVGQNGVDALHADHRPAHTKVVVQWCVHIDRRLLEPPQYPRDVHFHCITRCNCIQHVSGRLLVLRADEHPRDGSIEAVGRSDPACPRPRRMDNPHHGVFPVLTTTVHRHARRLAYHKVIVVLLDQLHLRVWNGRLVAVHPMADPDALTQRCRRFICDLLSRRTFNPQPTIPKRFLVVRSGPPGELLHEDIDDALPRLTPLDGTREVEMIRLDLRTRASVWTQ